MKVMVTGSSGQLGSETIDLLAHNSNYSVQAPTRSELDLSWPTDKIEQYVCAQKPDVIMNCAAMTAVDAAEEQIESAMQVNRDAPAALAAAAMTCHAQLLHVSTDYVFAGDKGSPYVEQDPTNPKSVYGQSKLAGEKAVLDILPTALIVRTAWVYGTRGNNFVKTILNKCLTAPDQPLRVVNDQIGSPTYTRDLANACIGLIDHRAQGVFHFSNDGVCSWYDLALAIVEEAVAAGFELAEIDIHSTNTAAFPRPAPRPHYSVLSKDKILAVLADPVTYPKIPHWRTSLKAMLIRLHAESAAN